MYCLITLLDMAASVGIDIDTSFLHTSPTSSHSNLGNILNHSEPVLNPDSFDTSSTVETTIYLPDRKLPSPATIIDHMSLMLLSLMFL